MLGWAVVRSNVAVEFDVQTDSPEFCVVGGVSAVTVAELVYWQPCGVVTVTVYVPPIFTVMLGVVAPLLQLNVFPVPDAVAVNVVVEPWQICKFPVI